jgi:metal-responsive CopG/Arc/MetJ family transcriptional regulator
VKKKRISIVLPRNASKEIKESMINDEYSLREKSKWISEAIEDFLLLQVIFEAVRPARESS